MKLSTLTLFFFIFSTNSFAFTLNNSRAAAYSQDEVTVNVASHTCNNLGVTNAELLSMVEEGVNAFWNRAPSSRLTLKAGSLVAVDAKFATDSVCTNSGSNCTPNSDLVVSNNVLISCNNDTGGPATNFTSSGVMAVTVNNNISGSTLVGSLILINDTATNVFQNRSHAEKVAILAHEIGHAIGLGHSKYSDNIMYYTTVPTRKYLGQDDIDGVSYLYPTEQPISGCGSIEPISNSNFFAIFIASLLLVLFLPRKLKKKKVS